MRLHLILSLSIVVLLAACSPKPGTIELVTNLAVNPGNITVSEDNRIFVSLHQFRGPQFALAEIIAGKPDYWPAKVAKLTAVLGVQIDRRGHLWALDNGLGEKPIAPRLFCFDIKTKKVIFTYTFKPNEAKPGSFLNDLAVDAAAGFVYMADIGGAHQPAIVTLNLKTKQASRFEGHRSLQAEKDAPVKVLGKQILLGGKPALIAINPITLSKDGETLFYGSMSGTKWYSVATETLQQGNGIEQTIEVLASKPISDGASTDAQGNHFFTGIGDNSLVQLSSAGELSTLAKDERLSWPDALSFGGDGWLYVAVNKLHLSPPLNQGKEGSNGQYAVYRVYTGTSGIAGR